MPPRASGPPTSSTLPILEELSTHPHFEKSDTQSDQTRPSATRRATEPATVTDPPFTPTKTSTLPLPPHNHSPLARNHLGSKVSASSLSLPIMNRAHSSPVPDVPGRTAAMIAVRPPSPLGHHSRRRSPMRRSLDETYSSFGGQVDIGETISENSELDLTPRADVDAVPSSPLTSMHHTFPRTRRRPSSPLHITQVSTQMGVPKSTLRSSISSPSLSSTQFNEPYPSSYFYASSSIPSTPTSFRSRSPSISSLETIPDSPNAEQEAVEADAVAKLKAAADRENDREEPASVRRRPSLDVVGRGGAMVLGTNGFGVVYGARDKRKRWSVCGAERRGDLDLETIWED